MKRLCAMVALALIVGAAGLAAQSKTPEDAIRKLIASLAAADYDKLESTFAVENQVKRFDFNQSAKALGDVNFRSLPLPNTNGLFQKINLRKRSAQVANSVENLVLFLVWTGADTHVKVSSDSDVADALSSLSIDKLKTLRVVTIVDPIADMAGNARVQSVLQEQAQREGANELTEKVCLAEYDGMTFYIGFRLLRYDTGWVVSQINSYLGNVYPFCPMTEQEFTEKFPQKIK